MNHWCHTYGTKVTGVTRLEGLQLQPVATLLRSFALLGGWVARPYVVAVAVSFSG